MTLTIDKPGLYDIPAEAYHRDPVVEPSLSRGVAKRMIERSPRHGWQAHPRLNPDYVEEDKTIFDIGKAFEQFMLEGEDGVVRLDHADYRKKDAQAERDAAYNAGKVPLLGEQFDRTIAMVEAARAQLAGHRDAVGVFDSGKPQQTLVWQEQTPSGPIWCRCLLDWLPEGRERETAFHDLKTTTNANPDEWLRAFLAAGVDMQSAFYMRGIRAVLGIENPRFRSVVVEKEPPHGLIVTETTPEMLARGDARVHRALELWGRCIAEDTWPLYPGVVHYLDPPKWLELRDEDAKMREQALRDQGIDPFKVALDWQRPVGAAE